MLDRTVVPNNKIAGLPLVPVNEFIFGNVPGQLLDEEEGFAVGHIDDTGALALTHVNAFSAREWVRADNRMNSICVLIFKGCIDSFRGIAAAFACGNIVYGFQTRNALLYVFG